MANARELVVSQGEGVYHCISRCVRRAYLCGFDKLTKKNFNHRKAWVRDRLIHLSQIFCIDVLGYALMSNHQHTILRTRPDLLAKLDNREIARRWLKLYPSRTSIKGTKEPSEEDIQILVRNRKRIAQLRKRLSNLSWFMKSLNEYLARRANAEDQCKGRFWEGRFKCERLYDEAAILSCSIYVDLNVIRAGIATTPESSAFTSAWERIRACKRGSYSKVESSLWLSPIQDTINRKGFLSIHLSEYLDLLDTTGREFRPDKRGKIPSEITPILSRLGLKPEHWIKTVRDFGRSFSIAAGSPPQMKKSAEAIGKKWLKGTKFARLAFF